MVGADKINVARCVHPPFGAGSALLEAAMHRIKCYKISGLDFDFAAATVGGDRVWGMGPRLILSNAQKSAGTHTPNPVGGRCGKYDENPTGLDVGSAAEAVSRRHGPVNYSSC